MELSDIRDQADADRYWLEHGPPTAVERHLAIRTAERAVIAAALLGADMAPVVVVLRRLMAADPKEGEE